MSILDTVQQDLRYAARSLRRNPGFASIVILTLALGIGANTAIFSVVESALIRAVPFRDSSSLVWITETDATHGTALPVDPPTLRDWREHARTLSGIAGWSSGARVAVERGQPIRRQVADVTADLFTLLGVRPALGRWIASGDDRRGAAPVVVLGHGLWEDAFGGDSAVVGESMKLDDASYTIIGVAPEGFDFPDGARLWTPLLPALGDAAEVRGAHYLSVIGRLAPGRTFGQARAELASISRTAAGRDPGARNVGVRVESLQNHVVGDVRRGLLILLGAVTCVLLVACANVANVMLAHGIGRRRELAVRSALGASGRVLARQLLVESLLLSLLAGGVGLLLAHWSLGAIVRLAASQLPRAGHIGMDRTVLLYGLGTALLTGLVFGVVPALRAARTDPQEAFRDGGGGNAAGGLRRALLIGEVAGALVLLAVAGLMVESFLRLVDTDPGFTPDHLVAARITLPVYRYRTKEQQAGFFAALLERLAAHSDVRRAGLARNLPVAGISMVSPVWLEDRSFEGQPPRGQYAPVSPDYFRMLGIPLLEGRAFTERDDGRSQPVAVISAVLARRLFGDADPLGATLKTGFGPRPRRIVGVVGDVRHAGQATAPTPQVYVPFLQAIEPFETILVSGSGDERALMRSVRAEVRRLDPDLPLDDLTTMRQLLSNSVARPRFYLTLLGLFASAALLLAAVGVYGVAALGVGQRTRELGIRFALGARRGRIAWLVLREALGIGMAGVGLGLAGALLATRTLGSLLFEVDPYDPAILAGAAVALLAASLLASWLPARRGARIEPMDVLRAE